MSSPLKGVVGMEDSRSKLKTTPISGFVLQNIICLGIYLGSSLKKRGGEQVPWRRGGRATKAKGTEWSPGLEAGQRLACPHPCSTSYNTLGSWQYRRGQWPHVAIWPGAWGSQLSPGPLCLSSSQQQPSHLSLKPHSWTPTMVLSAVFQGQDLTELPGPSPTNGWEGPGSCWGTQGFTLI